MERIFAPAIIYRLIKYADQSAIALAFTPDYGKLKLFMPKAFNKKGGIMAFVPGEIDFLKKDNSDLNKLYGFRHDPSYMCYVEDPAISLRLNLLFDIIDNLYEVEQKEPVLWTLLLKFTSEPPPKVLIYTIYAMLKNTGLMFDSERCSECGNAIEDSGVLLHGQYFCEKCGKTDGITVNSTTNLILRALSRKELYKNIKITRAGEFGALDLFVKHIQSSTGKKLKSYQSFSDMVSGL